MSEKLWIFDTTLRDGEQVPGCQLDTREKIIVARALEGLGVDVIEAGFPISSPGDFNSVREISKSVTEPIICALSSAVEKDIEVAADSLKFAKKSRIHTGIAVSTYHIQHKLRSSPDAVLERAVKAVKFARGLVGEVEFYAEDAGRAENDYLAQMVEAVINAGATIINIPDTTGYCLPWQYAEKVRSRLENVHNMPTAVITAHGPNELGMATANTIAAVRAGARQVEVTKNGIGQRAGISRFEEVVMAIKSHKDIPVHAQIDTP